MRLLIMLVILAAWQARALAQTTGNGLPCPVITVSCPDTAIGPSLTFSAQVSGALPPGKVTYKWKLSAGNIVAGRDTDTITVDIAGLGGQTFTATVEVSGLPTQCPPAASCGTGVCGLQSPRMVAEYGGTNMSDEKGSLGEFAAALLEDPMAMGYILSYAGRRARAGEAQSRGERAKSYLVKERGFEEARIVIVDGGHREEAAVELFIVPSGSTPPEVSPTVEPKDVQVIAANDGSRREKP
jgi:hypothetical protein